MFLLIAASYWLGFGVLSLSLACRGRKIALLLPLLALTAAGLRPCRDYLARCPVRDVLAARGIGCLRGRRTAIWIRLAGKRWRWHCAIRCPVAAERAYWQRRFWPRISCGRRACPSKDGGDFIPAVLAFFVWCNWSITALSAPTDSTPCRPSWFLISAGSAISPDKTGSRSRGAGESAMVSERLLSANRVGYLLAAGAVRLCDAETRKRTRSLWHDGNSDAWISPYHITRSHICGIASLSCGTSSPARTHDVAGRCRSLAENVFPGRARSPHWSGCTTP